MLTSREAASVTLLAAFIAFAIFKSKDRKKLKESWIAVLRAFIHPKLLVLFVAYGIAVFASIFLASRTGLWNTSLIKDTVILVIFSAGPLLISKPLTVEDGRQLVISILSDSIGLAALATAYINLAPFSYFIELLVQFIATFLLIGIELSRYDKSLVAAGKLLKKLQGTLSVIIILWVVYYIVNNGGRHDWPQEARVFIFSAYLPISMIPFAYMVGLIGGIESRLVALTIQNKTISFPIKLAMTLGFHGSIRYTRAFCGQWLLDVAKAENVQEVRRIMRSYRHKVRGNAKMNRERERKLRALSGVTGRDSEGKWIDRREFHETKQALEQVYYYQMGLYRNRDTQYCDNERVVFPIGGFKELPADPGVNLVVSDDRQAWYASRKTIGGCYLAVGGSRQVDIHWRYSGDTAPSVFPAADDNRRGWCDQDSKSKNIDWEFDDSPAPMC